MEGTTHKLTVPDGEVGRLDSFIAEHLALSRTRAQKLVASGMVLLNGRADSAFVAQQYPANRPYGNEPLETLLMNDNQSKIQYERFLRSKLIRTLKNLGTRARIVRYETEEILADSHAESISNIYAVTYLDGGERKSFFVRVVVERMDNSVKTTGFWRVKRFQGGIRPRGCKSIATLP